VSLLETGSREEASGRVGDFSFSFLSHVISKFICSSQPPDYTSDLFG
jgi:hypothetical protein